MGSTGEEESHMPKNQDFISINQKITLPENYKKFSTIKLKIKPAKLIFVGNGSDSNNDSSMTFPAVENGENNEDNTGNVQLLERCPNTFRSDPSYLLGSAESLSITKEQNEKRNIPTHFKSNQRARRSHYGNEDQVTQCELNTNASEPNEDCEIVKELVLEKFKDLLQKFIEKSNSRRIVSMDQEDYLKGWTEYENIHILDPFIFNLQQEANEELQRSDNKNISKDVNRSEDENITEMSPEPSNKNYGRQRMTIQDTETVLEPQKPRSDQRLRREFHPQYVHISEPMETVESLQIIETKPEAIESQSIVSYHQEDYFNERQCNYFENRLKEEINEQDCAITQVLKVLSMCEGNKKLSESVLRVEAERVLLIATIRKEILNTELTNSNWGTEDDNNGFVIISGLTIPLEHIREKKTKQTRFFICIVRCGSTVLCSDLLVTDGNMELVVGEPFCFEELPTDFEIIVEIYTMNLKIREKSSGFKILKKYRNLFFGFRSRFRNTTESTPREISTSRMSAFTLIGKTVITRSTLQLREFPMENLNPQNFSLTELKCNIGSGVKLDIFLSGFLMVCESSNGKTRWRRQWCILDASELKFWDYPGKEQTTDPNTIIDLSRSLLPYIVLADKKFCSRPRSLHLKIGPDSAHEEFYQKEIFLSADNPKDFLFWEKELNRVLKNLINWGCMRTYFENSI